MNIILSLLTGPLLRAIMGVVDKYFENEANRDILEAEIKQAILSTYETGMMAQKDVILAELQSEDMIARVWRSVVGLLFAFIIAWYALFVPILVNWFGVPPLQPGELLLVWIKDILIIAIGGYIGLTGLKSLGVMLLGFRRS